MLANMDQVPLRVVSLDSIAWDDERFALRRGRDDAAGLGASLQRVGMLTPPVLADLATLPRSEDGGRKDGGPEPEPNGVGQGRFAIVCGFARLRLWRSLGRRDAAARVAPPGAHFVELLYLAVEDNLGGRGLNVIEQAIALEKLAPALGEERLVAEALPRLGLPPSPSVLERLRGFRKLSARVQEALARGRIAELAATALAPFDPDEQDAVLDCTTALRMSAGASRDCAQLVFDISRRDGAPARQVLRDVGFDPRRPLELAQLPGARARLLDALRKRRHPILSRLEAEYAAAHKALGLGDAVAIRPPRDFEGDRYVLEAPLSSRADLERLVETLSERLRTRRETVERLFDVRWKKNPSEE